MYQRWGQVITPHDTREVLFVPALDTCFWHNTLKIFHDSHAFHIKMFVYTKSNAYDPTPDLDFTFSLKHL